MLGVEEKVPVKLPFFTSTKCSVLKKTVTSYCFFASNKIVCNRFNFGVTASCVQTLQLQGMLCTPVKKL